MLKESGPKKGTAGHSIAAFSPSRILDFGAPWQGKKARKEPLTEVTRWPTHCSCNFSQAVRLARLSKTSFLPFLPFS